MIKRTLYMFAALAWLIGALVSAESGELLYALIKVIIGEMCLIIYKISEIFDD